MTYELQIGATRSSFSTLGISAATLKTNVKGSSQLTLNVAQDFNSSAIIAPFQRADLYVDNVLRFSGWLDEAPRSMDGGSKSSVQYRLNGPHRWLDRTLYSQSMAGVVVLAGPSPGQPSSYKFAVDVWSAAVARVLPAALAKLSGATYTIGSGYDYQIPARTRSDITVSEALRSLLAYAPDAKLNWSYSGGANAIALQISKIGSSAEFSLNSSSLALADASVNPRYDLLYSRIIVYWMKNNEVVGVNDFTLTGSDAVTLGADRTKTYTFDTGAILNVPSAGLDQAFAGWHGRLKIEASATRQGINWSDVPGSVWSFGGSHFSHLSGYTTILESVERDLFSGSTKLSFGTTDADMVYEKYNSSDFDRASGNSNAENLLRGIAASTSGLLVNCPETETSDAKSAVLDCSTLNVKCPDLTSSSKSNQASLNCQSLEMTNGDKSISHSLDGLMVECPNTGGSTPKQSSLNCEALEITNGDKSISTSIDGLMVECPDAVDSSKANSSKLNCSALNVKCPTASSNHNQSSLNCQSLEIIEPVSGGAKSVQVSVDKINLTAPNAPTVTLDATNGIIGITAADGSFTKLHKDGKLEISNSTGNRQITPSGDSLGGTPTDGKFNSLTCSYLNDTGSADIGANLNVGGNANVTGNVQATASLIGAYLSTTGSADIGANLNVTGNITLVGSFSIGSNTFSAIEIERCDGKKMKVLGTGWA